MTDPVSYEYFNNEAAWLLEERSPYPPTSPPPDKDWYEAYADAVHVCGKAWPEELTCEEELFCEMAADSVAVRPECEK